MQKIVILDFGGQYTQLIARRVRECHVYSEVVPWSIAPDEIKARQPSGIILSGGPASVTDPDAPHCDPAVYNLGVPVLGICCRTGTGTGIRARDGPDERSDRAAGGPVPRIRLLDEPYLAGQ